MRLFTFGQYPRAVGDIPSSFVLGSIFCGLLGSCGLWAQEASYAFTRNTGALPASPHSRILRGVGVPVYTHLLGSLSAESDISEQGHGLQVPRLDTTPRPALVIQGHTIRYFALKQLVGETMGKAVFAPVAKVPIPVLVWLGGPEPTRRGLSHLRPESLLQSLVSLAGHSQSFYTRSVG